LGVVVTDLSDSSMVDDPTVLGVNGLKLGVQCRDSNELITKYLESED
jgi:hypothetical protein